MLHILRSELNWIFRTGLGRSLSVKRTVPEDIPDMLNLLRTGLGRFVVYV